MRKPLIFVVSAALGVGTFSLLPGCEKKTEPQVNNPNGKGPAERAGEKIDNAAAKTEDKADEAAANMKAGANDLKNSVKTGVDKAMPSDAGAAYDVIKDVTEDAFTTDKFDDLVGNFAKADRDRLKEYADGKNFDDLNAKINSLRADWKAKYKNELDIKNEKDVFGPVAHLNDVKDLNGMGTANLVVDKSGNLPELKMPMVRETGAWHFDVSDKLDGPTLKANLMKHLDMIQSDKANWPADPVAANRYAAHHILMALADQAM